MTLARAGRRRRRSWSRAPSCPGRIGILGGTFDPIHLGHLAIAEAAREALGLERVLFVPASLPPHRSIAPGAPAPTDRAAMVELAIAGNPAFELSLVELERGGPSYTAETVERLAADVRRAGHEPDLHFILSAEAFADFPTWNEPDRVLAACAGSSSCRARAIRRRTWRRSRRRLPGLAVAGDRPRRAGHPPLGDRDQGPGRAAGCRCATLCRMRSRAYIAERRLYRSAGPAPVDADRPTRRPSHPSHPDRLRDRSSRSASRGVDAPCPTSQPIPAPPSSSPSRPRPSAGASRACQDDAGSGPAGRGGAGRAAAPRGRPPDRRHRRGQEGGRHRPARPCRDRTTLADYFVICSGGSERQIEAIADGVIGTLRDEGVRPIGREGEAASHWILVDFGSVIVHIFTPPERDYYELEKHWSEAKTILRVQ